MAAGQKEKARASWMAHRERDISSGGTRGEVNACQCGGRSRKYVGGTAADDQIDRQCGRASFAATQIQNRAGRRRNIDRIGVRCRESNYACRDCGGQSDPIPVVHISP